MLFVLSHNMFLASDKKQIEEVLLKNFHLMTTGLTAESLAAQMGLAPGSVVFGSKTIEITKGGKTLHIQYTPQGGVIFLDHPPT